MIIRRAEGRRIVAQVGSNLVGLLRRFFTYMEQPRYNLEQVIIVAFMTYLFTGILFYTFWIFIQ